MVNLNIAILDATNKGASYYCICTLVWASLEGMYAQLGFHACMHLQHTCIRIG